MSLIRIIIFISFSAFIFQVGCGYFPTESEGPKVLDIVTITLDSDQINPDIPITVTAVLDTIPGRSTKIFWNCTGGNFYSVFDGNPTRINPTQWLASEPGTFEIICTVSDSLTTKNKSISVTVTLPHIELPELENTSIVFCSKMDGSDWELYKMNPDGTNLIRLTDNDSDDLIPRWSPDGSKIAFYSDREGNFDIYIMNSDGTGLLKLTSDPEYDACPTWSPDGFQIAFETYRHKNMSQIYLINADGSGEKNICDLTASSIAPHWSKANNRITYCSKVNKNREIYIMDSDGSNKIQLTSNNTEYYSIANEEECPSWSPDGRRITFSVTANSNWEVFSMNSDGSDLINLTNNNVRDHSPSWSPDGSKIVYFSNLSGSTTELYIMDPDGSNKQRITYNSGDDFFPDWSPIMK
ncbi:MAG: DUF5050 domain-containing protein [bacterium]|nr:DUF5050 domain-containing protein [bacterium]